MLRRVFAALGIALALVILGLALGWAGVSLDRGLPSAETDVVIAQGAPAGEIGRRLASAGVIRSALAFGLLVRLRRAGSEMRAGEYRFPAHESPSEVLDRLLAGGRQVAVWVTIPEGFTARQIALTLQGHGFGGAQTLARYFAAHSLVLSGARTRSLEGYLFPDTYLLPVGAGPAVIARMLTAQFRRELPADAAARARRLGLDVPQVVTLASLVEREAKADDERALMAGVYYNRLRLGMPLEVDATIEYTFAHHKDVITLADLARDSPYNTYKHAGLPPTPIANPGRPSLVAAFEPRPSAYLYYVYKGNGHHAFSRTLAEHNANIARYLH
jgi:UPF0755 protein